MINRIRNAWRALFSRNPTITVEVTGGTWSAKWKHMTPNDAAALLYSVANATAEHAFARMLCKDTIH
jgi:hypothetical protein